jgi:Family of unknown function (DUF5681)
MVDNTAKKQRGRPFEPGRSGNPAGRPKGSRNKFGEEFIAAVAQDWADHGSEVLARVRKASPATYLRTVARLVPQHLAVTHDDDWSTMTDKELREELQQSMAEMLDEMGMAKEARAVRARVRDDCQAER